MEEDKWPVGAIITGICGGLIAVGFGLLGSYVASPANVRMIGDLNKDGIHDAYVVDMRGRQVPMYGTKDGKYVSADEFKKQNPNTITDFSVLEERLNENAN